VEGLGSNVKNIVMLLFCLFAVACNSCTPQPAPLPPPAPAPIPTVVIVDAGPAMGGASPIDAGPEPMVDPGVRTACQNAAAIGCSEANPIDLCLRVVQRVVTENLTAVPLACMVAATDKPSMQRCGFIRCP
jgi:hypothetical protein